MILLIFIIALIIYLIYINKKKEGFALNSNNITTYYLIGHFPLGYTKYIQLYESLNENPGLKGCGDVNYSNNINNRNGPNYFYVNNLIKLNTEKYFTYDICGVEIFNNIIKNRKTNYEDDNNNKSVYIFSYGNKDIVDLKIKSMMNGEEITEESKRKQYYTAINKVFGNIYDIPDMFIFDLKNLNKHFLFLNLITNDNEEGKEDNKLWNEVLLEVINNKNKSISNNGIIRNNFKIINVNDIKVNEKGENVSDGIPKDLHEFICKNERCKINNKHNCKNIPSLRKLFKPL